MSDLLASLSSAARALDAQRLGLDVTGQNIANANTVGYTRRTVDFAEVPPVAWNSAGNGVEAVKVRAIRSDLIEAQLRHEQSPQGRESAIFESLSRVEAALGTSGSTLDSSLTDFYDAFSTLAQDPTSGAARLQVAVQGQALAAAFNDTASRIAAAQADEDQQVRSTVDQVNALAQKIASLNASLGSGSLASESLRDDLSVALKSLSELVDIGVVTRPDGGADVSIGNGRGLVIGANAYAVGITSTGPSGQASLTSGTFTITGEITGGRLGGLLQARDVLVPDYMRRLDQLAYGVATSVNSQHQAGFDLNGAAGVAFFSPPAAVAGAASTLSMNAAVVADPRLIAAAGSPAAGDNQNARALSMLRQATIPGGSANPTDTWGALVYRVGTDTQVAKNEQASRTEIMQQLEALRDQSSAVSLDEEAANLMKFQRAYEANAKFFSAVDRSLDTLMQMIGV